MVAKVRLHRRATVLALAAIAVAPMAAVAQPAGAAFPKKDSVIDFAYKITATTHIKKLNQTITPPTGTFKGQIDLNQEKLQGSINLPQATFTTKLAGAVPLTATARIVQAKPVTGTINLANFKVKATSTFNLVLVSLYAAGLPVNLVGNSCTTSTPISVTMSGTASLSAPSKFSGTFTIPKFKTCGASTLAINELIPGPGNTFSAVARP